MTIEEEGQSLNGHSTISKARRDGGTHTKTTIFIPKLPPNTTGQDLNDYFSEWGPVKSAFTVEKGEGFIGFVHYALAEDAQRALSVVGKGVTFKGKSITGEMALRKKGLGKERGTGKEEKIEAGDKKKPPVTRKSSILLLEIIGGEGIVFDKKQLYKRIRKAGELEELVYPHNDDIRKARLIFTSVKEATGALAKIHEHTFKGHKFSVTMEEVLPILKSHRLIIRNLSFKAKKVDLEGAFSPFGKVLDVTLPCKPGTKVGRGFAFVQMKEKTEAERAMVALNGKEVAGRMVVIDWAVDKSTFERLQKEQEGEKQEEQKETVEEEEEFVDVENTSDKESVDDKEPVDVENISDEESIDIESSTLVSSTEAPSIDDALGTTVFIRNVSFAAEEADLKEALAQFGNLEYIKIVRDQETGATKGTAFAKFNTAKAAQKACEVSQSLTQNQLEAVENTTPINAMEESLNSVSSKLDALARKRTGKEFRSIVNSGSAGIVVDDDATTTGIVVDGRALYIVPAVDRTIAGKLKKDGEFLHSGPQDRRNLYLLNETLLKPKTTLARKFWPSVDISHREQMLKGRRKELKENPNLFVSKTRLSLRHLPATLTEAEVKRVLRMAAERALALQADDEGAPIIDDKLLRNTPTPFLKQVKIVRGERDRSKGYGFAEFGHHVHALMVVRYLGNFAPGLWRELIADKFQSARHKEAMFRAKAPVVEFATEKAAVIAKRQERLTGKRGGSHNVEKVERKRSKLQ